MHEQLDSDLTKRIAAVFENYEDPGANEGWLLLREKFPERNRRGLFWFWLSTAAVVLLFLAIGLWRYNGHSLYERNIVGKSRTNPSNNLVPKEPVEPTANGNSSIVKQKTIEPTSNDDNSIAKQKKDSVNNQQTLAGTAKTVKTNNKLNKSKRDISSPGTRDERLNGQIAQKKSSNDALNSVTKPDMMVPSSRGTDSLTGERAALANTKQTFAKTVVNLRRHGKQKNAADLKSAAIGNDSLENLPDEDKQNEELKQRSKDEIITVVYQKPTINLDQKPAKIKLPTKTPDEPKNSIYTMFAADKRKPDEERTQKSKKVEFGVFEATYLNYAKGSDNQVNLGVGVSSDIYLSDNLKLITGVSVGRNSLSYSGNGALNGTQNDNATLALGTLPATYSTANFTPATALKNYNAGLVALDIPINLKYELNPKNNNFYILTGLSSGTFVSETYSYQYNYQASSAPFNQQTLATTSNKNFNSFYFAKTINIAFGAGLPFGKNILFFEPFLKYPIGGLGSQEIHFGSTGLNLKFKFH